MQFDTDVLIWFLRGHRKAGRLVSATEDRAVSVVTYADHRHYRPVNDLDVHLFSP